MSTWRSDSEISLFNRSQQNDWQSISADTMTVIEYARRTSEQTLGAFDASVAPLVNLWGFGPTQAQSITEFSKPSPNAIAKTAYRVGYQSINVDTNSRAIRKDSTTNELDLSGIAKGFAVDKVALILDAYGINNYLVELGGELRSRGRNSQGKAWRVAIERPSTKQRSVYRIINLENSAVATSGDYRNFFLDGGVRYSHTIDPRTGSPSNHELASVSVIAETTMQADSLSTAFMVMGPGDALSYANTHGIAAHLILRSASGKLAEIHSDAFASFLS
ncbi:UNVERIFIED_CONTAM: hypothetical protein GTU68_015660 [Idotea baltica]|nr:hypothetical protein [Idotea baltica]